MTSIKMFCVMPKRHDISVQEFHDHWRHPHGTLGSQISTVRRYVQSHRINHESVNAADNRRYEGIVEVWFDSQEDALEMPNHPTYQRYLVPDEPTFIDMAGIGFVLTDENVVRSAPHPSDIDDEATLFWDERRRATTVKLIQVFSGEPPALDSASEAELGKSVGALRHTVCIPNPAIYNGVEPPFTGVRELWWPTVSDYQAGIAQDSAAWKLIKSAPAATALYQAERFL